MIGETVPHGRIQEKLGQDGTDGVRHQDSTGDRDGLD